MNIRSPNRICKKSTYRTDTISKKFLEIIRDLGFYRTQNGAKRTFHNLRHTFAVRVYATTRTIYYVRDCLGHSSVKVTEKYAVFNPAELAQDFNISKDNPHFKYGYVPDRRFWLIETPKPCGYGRRIRKVTRQAQMHTEAYEKPQLLLN